MVIYTLQLEFMVRYLDDLCMKLTTATEKKQMEECRLIRHILLAYKTYVDVFGTN